MAKAQRTRTVTSLKNGTATRIISEDDIAQRAYALYLARGGENGHDVEDWLAAERELRGKLSHETAHGTRENVLSQRFGTVFSRPQG